MLPIIKTDRTKAIEWWNSLTIGDQWKYTFDGPKPFSQGRHPSTLTGREIEGIWKMLAKPLPNDTKGTTTH